MFLNQPRVIYPPSVQQKAFVGLSEPLFSFVHAKDLHLGTRNKCSKANARIACLSNNVNVLSGPVQPSFVILSGDLTSVAVPLMQILYRAKVFATN